MVFTRTIKILTAVLIVMLPVGLYIMLAGLNQYLWTTNIFLLIQAIVTFIFMVNAAEQKSVIFTAAAIFVLAFITELTGLKTGFPFGVYTYSDILEPSVFGVPIAISLSWFSVVVNSYFIIRFLVDEQISIIRLLLASAVIVGIDFMLEPFASYNRFWLWTGGSVPVQNYVSWFVIGFIFSFLLERLAVWNRNIFQNINFITIPAVILIINILQFTVINVYAGYYLSTISGAVILNLSLLLSFKFKANEE